MTNSNAFACYMARPAGRFLRIVAGIALMAVGWSMRGSTAGTILMLVGTVPMLAGLLNVCLIAPIIGAPFSGRAALDADRTTIRRT